MTPSDRQGAGAPDVVLVGELAATMHRLGHSGGSCPVPARPHTCGAYRLAIKYAPDALAAAGRVLAEAVDEQAAKPVNATRTDAAQLFEAGDRWGKRCAASTIRRLCGVPEGAGGGGDD